MSRLADNLARVRERIARAAERGGRRAQEITLVAVTKGQTPDTVEALWQLGLRDFGENRVQEAIPKVGTGPPEARWHLIGHLQENKINKVLPWVFMIHSLDSLRGATALSGRLGRLGRTLPVLLEVKTDSAPAKHGAAPDAALDLFAEIAALPGLEARGLMTIAPWTRDESTLRASFGVLRRLSEQLVPTFPEARVLSMGMSDDLEIAIEEGATLVRVGRALTAAA